MIANRSFLLAAACVLPLPVAACGGDGENTVTPAGPHHGYVVSKATVVPKTPAGDYGLDLGGATSAKLDGKVDNKLGQALTGLSAFFDVQGTIDEAIDHGSIILLVDIQTADFASSSGAGLTVKYGSQPTPPACTSPTDLTCRHHLDGSATFLVATNSPDDALLAGKIEGGTFNGGPGEISLQIALGSTTAIPVNLVHARARAAGMSDTGVMSIVVGGLLTNALVTGQLAPAIKVQVDALLTTGCTSRTPGACVCTGSASTVLDLADTNDDCQVSVDELLNVSIIKMYLEPDSCSKDSCTEPDSLSVGLRVEAVKASFPTAL